MASNQIIPLWLKILYTLMVLIVVPIYWRDHGPSNFLWFSDIALLSLTIALWARWPLIASMMAVGVLPLEFFWLTDFLALGNLFGIAAYMFDPAEPLYLRALSLFHVPLLFVIIYMLVKFGYDPRAFRFQTGLVLLVIPVTYFVTDPAENINWVFGPGFEQNFMSPLLYMILWTICFPIFVLLPTHFALKKFFSLRE